jgi:hypothetical protein
MSTSIAVTRLLAPTVVMACVGCSAAVPIDGDSDSTTGETDGESADSTDTTDATDPTDPTDPSGGSGVPLPVNKDVDILFVIDNSGSMGEEQGRLAADIGALVDVLEDPAVNASYRIGVTTTDNNNPWCGTTSPEAGNLVLSSCRSRTGEFVFGGNPPADATAVACTDLCNVDAIEILPTTTEYDAQPRPRPWLESIDGSTNVGGGVSMTDALQCAVPQGIAGCGFEAHLESMYKAFLRSQTDDEEQYGFLRSTAILSIVVMSDEVDCSYNTMYESIFLPEDQGGNPGVFWSDPGSTSPTSAVCWNAGVSCQGSGSPYDSCVAANKDVNGSVDVSDSDAVMHPVSRYANYVQELESIKQEYTPNQEVLVALLTGVPVSYDGELTYSISLDANEQSDFGIGPGCTYDDGDPGTPLASARPPVREKEFAEAFEVGGQTNLYSICQETYTGALGAIANSIRDQIRPACMPVCVADTDPITSGLQPSCTVTQESPQPGGGGIDEIDIPQCGGNDSLPDGADVCYVMLVNDALSDACAEEGWNLEFRIVRREGVPAPGGTSVTPMCQLSQNKQIDCPNLP